VSNFSVCGGMVKIKQQSAGSTGMYICNTVTVYLRESTGIIRKIPVTLFVRYWLLFYHWGFSAL
jgi:hypothetical protein